MLDSVMTSHTLAFHHQLSCWVPPRPRCSSGTRAISCSYTNCSSQELFALVSPHRVCSGWSDSTELAFLCRLHHSRGKCTDPSAKKCLVMDADDEAVLNLIAECEWDLSNPPRNTSSSQKEQEDDFHSSQGTLLHPKAQRVQLAVGTVVLFRKLTFKCITFMKSCELVNISNLDYRIIKGKSHVFKSSIVIYYMMV